MGIKHLRSYLDLAEQGTGALPYDGRRSPAVDLHREEIADALRDRGFVVATDVGLSDFKVDISVATQDAPDRPSDGRPAGQPCLGCAANSRGPGRAARRCPDADDALACRGAGLAAGVDQRQGRGAGQAGGCFHECRHNPASSSALNPEAGDGRSDVRPISCPDVAAVAALKLPGALPFRVAWDALKRCSRAAEAGRRRRRSRTAPSTSHGSSDASEAETCWTRCIPGVRWLLSVKPSGP